MPTHATSTDPAEPALLELKGVVKTYRPDAGSDLRRLLRLGGKRPRPALDGVTMRFFPGRCTALLGHNGAGKTTAIRLALGLARPDAGAVLFDGRPLATADKRHIGYMPEVNKLPHGLTAFEVLDHHLRLLEPPERTASGERPARIRAKLADVGLAGFERKRVGKLSKGMARRLAWAQASIHAPRLLILDEPASGLDPFGRQLMLGWIAAEKARGAAILLCTHELAQVSTLSDAYYVLQRGRLAFGAEALAAAAPRYQIDVNGLAAGGAEAAARTFAGRRRLPLPERAEARGLTTTLVFADYGAAAVWIAALVAEGLIVTRFGSDHWPLAADLRTYFAGEGA